MIVLSIRSYLLQTPFINFKFNYGMKQSFTRLVHYGYRYRLPFFTFFLLFIGFQAFSQKDVSAQLLEPVDGQDITPNDSFTLKLLIQNIGTEPITNIDPMGIDAFAGSNLVYSDVMPIPLGIGQSTVFEKKVAFKFTGEHLNEFFCGSATVLFSQDPTPGNNGDCNTVDLVQATSTEVVLNTEQFNAIYSPNPSSGTFQITANGQKPENLKLNIFDCRGRAVYSLIEPDLSNELDLSHLPKGLYYAVITGNKTQITNKIIIE